LLSLKPHNPRGYKAPGKNPGLEFLKMTKKTFQFSESLLRRKRRTKKKRRRKRSPNQNQSQSPNQRKSQTKRRRSRSHSLLKRGKK